MDKELAPELALRYAGNVKAGREAFAAAFDAVAVLKDGDGYLDFKMVALGKKDHVSAYAAAFTRAKRDGFFDKLLAHLTEAGLIAMGEIAPPNAAPGQLGLVPQDATALTFQPQGWTPAMIGLVDVSKMVPGLLAATRRVCLVCIDGVQMGSGFLVGPQTVITNWHVMCSLIDPVSGTARDGSGSRITCDFDAVGASIHSVHPAVQDWLVEWSPMGVTDSAIRVDGTYPDMTGFKPTTLDFCIIRLQGAPGRARGWYDLAAPGQIRMGNTPFFVVQHPAQFAMRVGISPGVTVQPGNPQIRHLAPTQPGSSGGLCLDTDFIVVGLHQGELKNNNQFVTNLAIRAADISAAAPNSAEARQEYDSIWLLQKSRRAVIGRYSTLLRINNMKAPGAPKSFLVVGGDKQSGKSFTADLIEDRINFNDRILVRFEPDALPADARSLAIEILSQAGVEQAVREELPTPAGTTDIAWIKNQLIPAFRQRIGQAAGQGQRLVWIILDRLDQVEIAQTTARSFLDALYEVAPTMPQLRIVLIGLSGGLPAGDPARADFEDLADPENPDPKEIEHYLGCVLNERQISPTTAEIKRLSDIAMQIAKSPPDGSKPTSRLGRLATVFSDIYYKASLTW